MTENLRIAVHGFGTYVILYRHMIELARAKTPWVEWAVILPTSHHLDVVSEVIDADKLICLEDLRARKFADLRRPTDLGDYSGNFYADIEVEKNVFKHRPSDEQERRAFEVYSIYKKFLSRIKPTHILMSHIETFDGKVLVALAGELGIPLMAPTELRNLGGVMFSPDAGESIPAYRRASADSIRTATEFLEEFRRSPKSALPQALFDVGNEQPLSLFRKPLYRRAFDFARRSLRNPELFEPSLFALSFKYTFPGIREAVRSVRGFLNGRKYDYRSIEEMPSKFIYFPLQTTPESSINTPAPYYIDQMRAIDAIRFAMPSDYELIIKEHWASIGIRPPSFYKALRRKAGVRIAHFSVPSIELIKRAEVTMSVTGTATLEAFLLGRPSLVLGACFIAEHLGGICSIEQLKEKIRSASKTPPNDDFIIRALAEIYSVRYECVARSADEPGYFSIQPENVRRLLSAVLDHTERLKSLARMAHNNFSSIEAADSNGFTRAKN